MASATLNPAKTVEVAPATITLELSMREAMLIEMYLSYTNTATSEEAEGILAALSRVEVEDYYDQMHITVEEGMYSPVLLINDGPNPLR